MARKCVLCGKEYEYCPSCPKDITKALWHKLYDTENCRNIFEALNNYNFKLATKEETRELLSKCDLTIELNDHYRGEIEEIMAKPKKALKPREAEPKKEAQEEAQDGVVTIE